LVFAGILPLVKAELLATTAELRIFAENRSAMRPILMIENVKNLHDARYCAAVGIAMATFELDPLSPHSLSLDAVREIGAWLSGLDCIGKFPKLSPSELNAHAEAAQIEWVQIPLSYDLALVPAIGPQVIFAVDHLAASLQDMLAAHDRFPEALFLVAAPSSGTTSALEELPSLLSRCLLRYDAPDAIYQQLKAHGLKPFGFSLGSFSADSEGMLDYDACDAFIDQYQEMALA
jgi:phosphoribosylanthranilate isomerase